MAIRGFLDLLSREYHLRLLQLTRVSAARRSLDVQTQESCEISNLPGILWVALWSPSRKPQHQVTVMRVKRKVKLLKPKGCSNRQGATDSIPQPGIPL
jgi:hypothetical protein